MEIIVDDLNGHEVQGLLREHLRGMHWHWAPGRVHALDVEGLRGVGITFWTVWEGGELLGCGALKELDRGHGEIKSMRTAAAHLRKGVARRMVAHILAEARRRGYRRVSLEMGSAEAFLPARMLYE